jgi:putative hydrolase of the HAD superfamily
MIRNLLLDLDNTLYPASQPIDAGITRRMNEFVATFLGVPFEEGVTLRAKNMPLHGSTLEWLCKECGLTDRNDYFNSVHPESEIDELTPDPALRGYLVELRMPMSILTNSPMSHAKRLLDFYGISDLFTGIYDITWQKNRGKPYPEAYLDSLAASGFTLGETLFVDDLPKYVRGYKAIGGQAVLVDETGKRAELSKTEGFGHITSIYQLEAVLGNY